MFFGTVEKPPRLSAFYLEVPDNLIADKPSKQRDNSKLMVLNRKEMSIEHKKFKDIPYTGKIKIPNGKKEGNCRRDPSETKGNQ